MAFGEVVSINLSEDKPENFTVSIPKLSGIKITFDIGKTFANSYDFVVPKIHGFVVNSSVLITVNFEELLLLNLGMFVSHQSSRTCAFWINVKRIECCRCEFVFSVPWF